jgi:hypothetical protein
MNTIASFAHDPLVELCISINQVAIITQWHEVVLGVFDAGLNATFFLRIGDRAWRYDEAVPFSVVGVTALNIGIVIACLSDGALRIINIMWPPRLCGNSVTIPWF